MDVVDCMSMGKTPSMSRIYVALLLVCSVRGFLACSPGKRFARSQKSEWDIEHRFPDTPEWDEGASGPLGRVAKKNDSSLRRTINTQIVYRQHQLNSESRLATKICTTALLQLSESVQQQWSGKYKLYVVEGYTSQRDVQHRNLSLHLEGRAFDLKLANSDPTKPKVADMNRHELQRLAGLAYYNTQFSFVEVKQHHIHVSCKREDDEAQYTFSRCFPAEAFVRNAVGEKILMKNLLVGDRIATMNSHGHVIMSEVSMIMHKQEEAKIDDYVKIRTSDGKSLVLSSHHLIFLDSHEAVFSMKVRPGQYVYTYDVTRNTTQKSLVVEVKRATRPGAYAPLTLEGTIIVNDVYASCFAMLPSHYVADIVFSLWRFLYKHFGFLGTHSTEYHWYPNTLRGLVNYFKLFSYDF